MAARRGNIVAFLSYTQDLFYTGSSIANGLPLLIVSGFRGFHLLVSRCLLRVMNCRALNCFGLVMYWQNEILVPTTGTCEDILPLLQAKLSVNFYSFNGTLCFRQLRKL